MVWLAAILTAACLTTALSREWQRPAGWQHYRISTRTAASGAWRQMPGTYVVLETTAGEIVLRMLPDVAPATVANFVGLVEGTREFIDHRTGARVKRPFYDGLTFHRVLRDVMIQGGCPRGDGTGGPGYLLADERPIRAPYTRGAVCMARIPGRPNTAGSQFFILLSDVEGQLPREYVVFARVVSGMEVADAIGRAPTTANPHDPTEQSTPLQPVVIRRAVVVRIPVRGGRGGAAPTRPR